MRVSGHERITCMMYQMYDIVGVTCWVTNIYGGDYMRSRASTEETTHERNYQ